MNLQEQIDFVLGPQVPVSDSWLDQTLITKGRQHLDACPLDPPVGDNELNSFILLHYYDLPLSGYIIHRRTGDPADLQRARKASDSWWKHPTWIGEGKVRNDGPTPSPRHAGVGGLILRALDGRPEMWDWIAWYVSAQMDIWCNLRVNNDQLWYGPREVAFTMQYAAWVAMCLPDSYPNAVQVRAKFIADLETLVVNYTGRLQYPDGSWRDSSEWIDNVRAMLSANAPVNTTQLKVIALDFPVAAGQKVAFEKGGVTKTTKPQPAGSVVIDIEPLPVARTTGDVLYVDDGTVMSGTMQPFIVGLLICALVDIHQVVSGIAKESAKNQILKACRHLYSDGPYAKDLIEQRSGKPVRGFHYFFHGGTNLNPTKYAKGSMVAPWTDYDGWWLSSARQAISTILPSFGYAFRLSGDQFYKDAAAEMYDSAYGGGDGFRSFIADTAKNYNQHARRVGSLQAWMGGAVPLPAPIPEPLPTEPTPTLPVPEPTKTPSPDGTKGSTIVDKDGGTWAFGKDGETLRNGEWMGRGKGSIYKHYQENVYVLGTDSNWYVWIANWNKVGTEPGGTVTPPAPEPVPEPPKPPDPPPPPQPVPEEYRIEVIAPKDNEPNRTKLYQRMFALGFAAYEEVSGPNVKFRRFK